MARNLVLLVADTLRHPDGVPGLLLPTHMPFLASQLPRAREVPHLVASSSWTLPSHLALLSGTHPADVGGVLRSPQSAPRTLATAWRKAGGESLAFSANYLVQPSMGVGRDFDAFNPRAPFAYSEPLLRAWQSGGMERRLFQALSDHHHAPGRLLPRLRAQALWYLSAGVYRGTQLLYHGPMVTRSLDRSLRGRSRKPLFLFVNLLEAHEPYLEGEQGPWPDWGHLPGLGLCQHGPNLVAGNAQASVQRAYRSALGRLDSSLAGIFATLSKHGYLEDTLVLLVSDHGQSLGEHGFYGHGYHLYDELVRIPGYFWEFQGGRARETGPLPPGPWDHRHLASVLGAWMDEPSSVARKEPWDEARARLGPALSLVDAVPPHPPEGLKHPAVLGPRYLQTRVFPPPGPHAPLPGRHTSLPGLSAALEDPSPPVTTDPTSGPLPLETEVEERLRTWGYL
jgi:hypothetical protein